MSDRGSRVNSRESTLETTITAPDISPSSDPAASDKKKVPMGLAEPCRPRPLTSNCLNKNYIEIDGMCFQDMAVAMAAMNQAPWRAPTNDASIPQSDEDHRKVAKQLTEAFKDLGAAKDTQNNAYRKRLTKGEDVYYSDWAIEACAWNILSMVKSIHIDGFKIPIYDRTIIDSIGQTQLWTFQERIDWICLVLRTSKSIAVTLMKHEKIWTTIGAPHKLYNSTLVNTISNGQRNNWVKVGREADEQHQKRPNKRQRATSTIIQNSADSNTTNTSLQTFSNGLANNSNTTKGAKGKQQLKFAKARTG
ncbi:uncharacterized protein K460DRAFT_282684 [Cucurbitaria berberidis CBS 394.84]|uniref:Uncharacterized protein n=1 Tax=Cucurbitaria berberidis CBS 394.84 TaxID=1168544 RepID=A0A9P4L9M4_9PLEO|nr:uncharacterized protein K460DRAFT_282684 [Cucurbitaria berberidis CBS 394.84]KAF1846364.1 hypothetical protein K460DRAFT_282684 [Cucurbitaria berberidis CBS 394.84]